MASTSRTTSSETAREAIASRSSLASNPGPVGQVTEQVATVSERGLRAEYRAWWNAIQRCHNPRNSDYHRYGRTGISVCARWRCSLETFLADMGRRPGPGYSLDRYPNPFGNYEPGNCRWATQREQGHNMRNNVWAEAFGLRLILADWARGLGINLGRLWYLHVKHGLSIEQIVQLRNAGELGRRRKKAA